MGSLDCCFVKRSPRNIQKSYLGIWLQCIVTVHLRDTSKATHYRNTSLKYKAMLIFNTHR